MKPKEIGKHYFNIRTSGSKNSEVHSRVYNYQRDATHGKKKYTAEELKNIIYIDDSKPLSSIQVRNVKVGPKREEILKD